MTDRKKILIAVHSLSFGGIQKSLIEALDVIDYEKYDVELFVLQNKTQLLCEAEKQVKTTVCVDKRSYYKNPIYLLPDLLSTVLRKIGAEKAGEKIYRANRDRIGKSRAKYAYKKYFSSNPKYDVAIAYAPEYTAFFVDKYVNADKKFVFFHSSIDENEKIHKKVFPHFDKIIAVNESCADMLKDAYAPLAEKICYITNFISPEKIRLSAAEEKNVIVASDFNICSCGRLSYEKGYDIALQAAKLLCDKGLNFHWYIVGDGREREELCRNIERLGIEKYITITGMKKNPYPYISGCDIFVQPSRNESFGLTVLEAMILYKPVISTRTDGGKRLVCDNVNGMLCDISADDIANKIMLAYENPNFIKNAVEVLKNVDYSEKKKEYATKWNELLDS